MKKYCKFTSRRRVHLGIWSLDQRLLCHPCEMGIVGYQSVAVRLVIGRSQYDLRLSLHKLCPWAPGFSTSSGRLGGSCLVFIYFSSAPSQTSAPGKTIGRPAKKEPNVRWCSWRSKITQGFPRQVPRSSCILWGLLFESGSKLVWQSIAKLAGYHRWATHFLFSLGKN